LEKLKLN